MIEASVRTRTNASYKLNVQRVPAELGKRKLDELKPANVQDFYIDLTARGLAPRTVRQVHMTLHKALEDALGLGLVTRNATDGTSLPRISHEERAWYTDKELARLFQATSGDQFHALWVVLGTLGLRLGEALGLKWSDIDWEHSTLTIQRTLSRDRSGAGLVFSETKTRRSQRTLTLGRDAVTALKAHQDRQDFEHRKHEAFWHDNGLIFCTSLGTPLDQAKVHRHWTAATAKAGVPRYRIHDLRHAVASHLLAAGRPVERVARMLGHSSVTMLYEVYGHIIPTDYREEADAMESLLARHRQ
jgi:integrase